MERGSMLASGCRANPAADISRSAGLFRDERELADPSLPEPVAPEPVGGQQLIQCPATDLRGDVRGIGGKGVDQRIRYGTVRPAAVFVPADNEADPFQPGEHVRQ